MGKNVTSRSVDDLVMQFTVVKVGDGFAIDTHFAEGYDENALADVFEMWFEDAVGDGEEWSPGWGKP